MSRRGSEAKQRDCREVSHSVSSQHSEVEISICKARMRFLHVAQEGLPEQQE